MGFLPDTNIVSDVVRHPQGRVAAQISAVGEDNVCTRIVVAAELRTGAVRRASARIAGLVEGRIKSLTVENWLR